MDSFFDWRWWLTTQEVNKPTVDNFAARSKQVNLAIDDDNAHFVNKK